MVVLGGDSGTGKTTLIDIVVGLYAPTTGKVILDDNPVGRNQAESNGKGGIAYVQQETFLFDTTIRENLKWPGHISITDEDCWQALKIAEIDNKIRELPGGLDSRAGERGQLFSGGERQRICLARAIVQKPRLLVLDEATNALDPALEARIMSKLLELKRRMTIIVVSHRPDNITGYDQMLVLKDGKLSVNRR